MYSDSNDVVEPERPRSLFHRYDTEIADMQQASTTGRLLRSKWKPKPVSLAITELLPEIVVHAETEWEDEVVLDKRKGFTGHYEYLVKSKGMSKMCAQWKQPGDISSAELVQEFEEKRVKQIRDKTHLAAWYPSRRSWLYSGKITHFLLSRMVEDSSTSFA